MKKAKLFYYIIGVLLVLLLVLYGIQEPSKVYSPGHVNQKHTKLKCLDCHTPFKDVQQESCQSASCHPSPIGKEKVAELHKKTEGQNCLQCHREHVGIQGEISAKFDHKSFTDRMACADCHQVPVASQHPSSNRDCQLCHNVKAWKPATINHDTFFPLDRNHKVNCVTCHDKNSHNFYTCMNCHVHATPGIVAEHREENIRDFGDCLRCHRVRMNGRYFGTNRSEGESMIEESEDREYGERHFSRNFQKTPPSGRDTQSDIPDYFTNPANNFKGGDFSDGIYEYDEVYEHERD